MKILLVNKFFFIKGGAETYFFALRKLLEKYGHTVIDFSMADDRNFSSDYSDFFVSNVNYDKRENPVQQLKTAARTIYSSEAKRKFEALVAETQPDVIHLNNFYHQLSTSILDVIKSADIPCVYTAHDLKLVCPAYLMHNQKGICERCIDHNYFHCISNRCIKESVSKSSLATLDAYYNKFHRSYNVIDCIITPSGFYREKLIEWGIRSNRVTHIPNFLDTQLPTVNRNNDQYYLFTGRLSAEKGVPTLIRAFEQLGLPLKIAGRGEEFEAAQKYITDHQLSNIELLGFVSGQALVDIVGNAKAVILPSEWYENGPYSAIEALQLGVPIIGSDIGGIPELINGNGFLFKAGDSNSLAEAVTKLETLNQSDYSELCFQSRKLFQQAYTADSHYQRVLDIYQRAQRIHECN